LDDLTPQENYLVEEIRLNRKAIEKVSDQLAGTVGRSELFGWLSATGIIVGIALTIVM
jgi:hypothetical protein